MEFQQFIDFFGVYGWQLTLIAFIGIVILGVLKYAKVFANVKQPKPLYLIITVGFSVIATIIYLLIIKQFNFTYVVTVASAIYALNQTMYSIYETTTLKDLVKKVTILITENIKNNKQEK